MEERELSSYQANRRRAGRLSVSKPRSLGLGSDIQTTSLSFLPGIEGRES